MRQANIEHDFKFRDYIPPEIRTELRKDLEFQQITAELDEIIRLMEEVKQ